VTGPDIDRLIHLARSGALPADDQRQLADEFVIYRDAAHRLERAVHRLVKEAEE
jgi:hypothetical protein